MQYITIDRNENFERAKIRLRTSLHHSFSYYYPSSSPLELLGDDKILQLRARNGLKVIVSIDGPKEIIDKLFNLFV